MTVIDALLAHAERDPGALAFDVAGAPVTRAALVSDALRCAAGLRRAGVRPGDRVALRLGTSTDFLGVFFGAQLARAVPVALDTALPAEAIARRVALVRPALVVDAAAAASLRAADPSPPERLPGPDDLAFLQITSGTTGEPHAAMITHRNVLASLAGTREALGVGPGDVLASWMPLHHDLGLVDFVLLPTWCGLPCWLLPPAITQLRAWLLLMTRVGATVTGGPDFAYRLAARLGDRSGVDLGRLRVAIDGGEPVRASTIAAFERAWAAPGVMRPGYGLAEATLGLALARPGEPLRVDGAGHVACGRPLPGVTVRVRDGELQARGDKVFAGYFDDPEATRAAFTEDGWLRTGDGGAIDADGFVYVHGRRRALIKRAGALIAPREVEEAAERVAGVRLSAAIGVPRAVDDTEEVVVVVEVAPEVLADVASREALVSAVSAEVARAIGHAPGRVVASPPRTIPRTANGKVRHLELRRRLEGAAGP